MPLSSGTVEIVGGPGERTAVGAAGELGVAQAERVTTDSETVEANVAEMMPAAAAQADQVRAGDAATVERTDEACALAWLAARDAGWSTTQPFSRGYRRRVGAAAARPAFSSAAAGDRRRVGIEALPVCGSRPVPRPHCFELGHQRR